MTYSFDVVIVGGAIMGSSVAFFLSRNPDFGGTILVVERDPSYVNSSTARTNSCMRQQFSREVNIRISQFAAEFVRDFRNWMDDAEAPEVPVNHFGYMYLAANEAAAAVMEANQRVQASLGAGTLIMTPEEIAAEYPFYNVDGILCGSHNLVDEGWFDSGTVFDWWRRQARGNGVECPPDVDPPVAYDDFDMDHEVWESKVWPVLAHRIPAFERIKVTSRWAGQYAHNRLDHNAVVGPHTEVRNFFFINGFSGHGMQQSPAVGRAVSELITHGEYRTLDLSELGYERIARGEPFVETAII